MSLWACLIFWGCLGRGIPAPAMRSRVIQETLLWTVRDPDPLHVGTWEAGAYVDAGGLVTTPTEQGKKGNRLLMAPRHHTLTIHAVRHCNTVWHLPGLPGSKGVIVLSVLVANARIGSRGMTARIRSGHRLRKTTIDLGGVSVDAGGRTPGSTLGCGLGRLSS